MARCNSMNPYYRKAQFLTSASGVAQAPPDRGIEVAFAGRSNAGKSSALNTICDHKGLAKTSKSPGLTRLLNFFALDDERRLVDLPGYGFAKVPQAMQRQWQAAVEGYLLGRRSLRGMILVMDIRHPLTPFDHQMLEWNRRRALATHVLLSKGDKLSRSQAVHTLSRVRRELGSLGGENSAQVFSALKHDGLGEAHAVLDRWFEVKVSA